MAATFNVETWEKHSRFIFDWSGCASVWLEIEVQPESSALDLLQIQLDLELGMLRLVAWSVMFE